MNLFQFHLSVFWRSLLHTVFLAIFTILPMIFGLLFAFLFYDVKGLEQFYSKGEFFLYTVSLVSSAYISFTLLSSKKFFNGVLNIVSLIILVLVSGCYAFILSNTIPPRIHAVKALSFGAFAIAVILFYISQHMVNMESPDIVEKRKVEQKTIENKLK